MSNKIHWPAGPIGSLLDSGQLCARCPVAKQTMQKSLLPSLADAQWRSRLICCSWTCFSFKALVCNAYDEGQVHCSNENAVDLKHSIIKIMKHPTKQSNNWVLGWK